MDTSSQHLYPPQLVGYSKNFSASYDLRTSSDHTQLFVTCPLKLFGNKPILIVHDGTDGKAPHIVSVSKKSTFSSDSIVHVVKSEAGPATNVYFQAHCTSGGGHKNILHRFSMPVDSTGVVEDFEWRFQSRGIVSDYSSYGYELRRITNGEADVVAVLGLGAWSLHKAFTFALLGDGLEAQYGKAWEAVALATGVQTYLLEVERIASVAGAVA